jgi:hypothetical protein
MRAYQKYMAIKLHFTSDYDYFKYSGKTRAITESTFNARSDSFFFRKIERRYSDEDLTNYFVSNFIGNKQSKWIGELSSVNSEKVYVEWKKKIESFSYKFKEEMTTMRDSVDDITEAWSVVNGAHPTALKMYMANKLCAESMIAVNRVIGYIPMWDANVTDTIIYPEVSRSIKKYDGFLKLNYDQIKQVMQEVFL